MLGRHLLGIYEKAFPEDWSWERRLAEAKALGFDYMELSIDESDGRLERLLWSGRELKNCTASPWRPDCRSCPSA